MVQIDNLFNNN